jgi:hypothetical protein
VPPFFPQHLTMFTSFRLSVAKSLGFETFVEESLDDHEDHYAFLVPEDTPGDIAIQIRDFLQVCFSNGGFHVDRADFFEEGTYQYNWCGSRHLTTHLGRHWLFEVHPASSTSLPLPPKPLCDPWVVVAVDYDSLKPTGSYIRFSTTEMTAATPANYIATYNTIKDRAIQFISDICGKG